MLLQLVPAAFQYHTLIDTALSKCHIGTLACCKPGAPCSTIHMIRQGSVAWAWCRDDSEEDSEAEEAAPRKPVPAWARGRELMNQLVAQLAVDPDDIFQQRQRTCALDDVFSAPGGACLRWPARGVAWLQKWCMLCACLAQLVQARADA